MIRISTGLNDKNKNEFKLLELDNELVEALEKQQVCVSRGVWLAISLTVLLV